MTLQDLRRYAIRSRRRVGFTSADAGACLINEHGVLKIPAPAGAAQVRFDSSLAGVEQFVLTPVQESGRPQTVTRQHLETLLSARPGVEGGEDVE
jgi:hypothetical protein